MKKRWFQFSLRTMLIVPVVVLSLLWLGGRVEQVGHIGNKRAYVFIIPRLQQLHGINSIAFAREPRVRFICINWRSRPQFPTALVFHADGTVDWQHSRSVNGKFLRRIW